MSARTISTYTLGGKTFRCSERTAAHFRDTEARLKAKYPKARLRTIQGAYSHGSLSAGTHDFDAVLDVEIVGLAWWDAQKFLRQCGWAAWYRHTGTWASKAAWHIHMVSLGYETKVGEFVPGQVADYYRHALGLKNQHGSGSDGSWFPKDIDATVFVYPPKEKPVPPSKTPNLDAVSNGLPPLILAAQKAYKARKPGDPDRGEAADIVNLMSKALAKSDALRDKAK